MRQTHLRFITAETEHHTVLYVASMDVVVTYAPSGTQNITKDWHLHAFVF